MYTYSRTLMTFLTVFRVRILLDAIIIICTFCGRFRKMSQSLPTDNTYSSTPLVQSNYLLAYVLLLRQVSEKLVIFLDSSVRTLFPK